jgi:hypothetical protein
MMNKRLVTLAGVATWVVVAACSGNDANHPPSSNADLHDGGEGSSSGASSGASSSGASSSGASSSGASSSGASSGGHEDGAVIADGGADGTTLTDGSVRDVTTSPANEASMTDPACSPLQTWGAPTVSSGNLTFATQPLIAMTGDELTMAWVTDVGGGRGNVFVADRTSNTVAFGTPHQVMPTGPTFLVDGQAVSADAGDTYFAFDRVAISSDGLRLIGVAVGGQDLAQFIRTSRTVAFDQPSPMETSFEPLATSLMPGESLGDPVISADNEDLVYSKYGKSPTLTVYETVRGSAGGFGAGSGIGTKSLESDGGGRKRPTSMTGDRLVLFIWDEASNAAYGVLRGTPAEQFNYAIPFGDRFSIQINAGCTRYYYVAPGASGYVLEESDAM